MCGIVRAADEPSSADVRKAASQYDIGRERFRAGAYTEAAERFEAADAYAPSAPALRLAMAARKEAGHIERAATHAALAVERHPNDVELLEEAQAILSEVESELAKVHVSCDLPCELVLDERLVHGQAAQLRTLYAKPGTIVLRAGWSEERSDSERVHVTLDGLNEVSFVAPPLAPQPPVEPTEQDFENLDEEEPALEQQRKGWKPGVFWAGLALTGVGVGSTVGLGLNALNNPGADAVREECRKGDDSCETFKKGQRNQRYVNVAVGTTIGVGVLTLVTGIWLTDWGGGKDKKEALEDEKPGWDEGWGALHLRPLLSIDRGAVVGATGTF